MSKVYRVLVIEPVQKAHTTITRKAKNVKDLNRQLNNQNFQLLQILEVM
jgi:hypothetical protein